MKVLITGGSGDLGSAIIRKIKEKYEDATIYEINRRDLNSTFYKCDLTNEEEISNLCNKVKEMDFDVLINCAGWSTPISFEKLSLEDINKRMNINFKAPLLLMQAVLPNMKKNKKGIVINISSVTSVSPIPNLHIYGAAKKALDAITISTAKEYAKYNVRINGIRPGAIKTKAAASGRMILGELRNIDPELYENNMRELTGFDRLLDPEEVANTVAFLISDESSGITGQFINVCGLMEVH